ncbi:MAG: hypothetical protein IKV97_04680 [Clostridia bacterium]|nr:hypothetical protein [Clostridia bacterium]
MRQTRIKIHLTLIILISALAVTAIFGIVLNIFGIRYFKADNGSKFLGITKDGVVLSGTIMLPDGTKAKIDRARGVIEYSNGDIYDGEFSGFYRNGQGHMTYAATGDTYEGQFSDDKMSGKGIYRSADGSVYDGEFLDGKKSGTGKYIWSDGSTYEGGFLENRKNGSGKYHGADGAEYVGDYENDRKNGKGTYTYPNGDKYIGDFVDDMRQGLGTYIWANGESYVGEFLGNMKHGKGVYKWPAPTERSYDGYFENGTLIITDPAQEQGADVQTEQ